MVFTLDQENEYIHTANNINEISAELAIPINLILVTKISKSHLFFNIYESIFDPDNSKQ